MPGAVGELPREAGAYVLLINLGGPLSLDMPAFRGKSLAPGLYGYCGSAFGPGGIRARVSRHLRGDKPMRWHVDRLTVAGRVEQAGIRIGVAGRVEQAGIRIGGRECDLAGELLARGCMAVLPGFGSSDCRGCPAHLLRMPEYNSLPKEIFDLVVLFERKTN
jgi:Uri superfamily endonuclease